MKLWGAYDLFYCPGVGFAISEITTRYHHSHLKPLKAILNSQLNRAADLQPISLTIITKGFHVVCRQYLNILIFNISSSISKGREEHFKIFLTANSVKPFKVRAWCEAFDLYRWMHNGVSHGFIQNATKELTALTYRK